MKCHNDVPNNLNFRPLVHMEGTLCHTEMCVICNCSHCTYMFSDVGVTLNCPLFHFHPWWLCGVIWADCEGWVSSPNLCKSQPNWVADKYNCLIQHQLNPSAASQLTSWLNFTPIQNLSVAPIMVTNATNHHQINLDKHTLLSICFPDCLFKGKSVTHEHLSTSPPSQVSASVFGVFSVCYSLVIIIVFGVCYLLFIVSQYSVVPLPLSVSFWRF